MVYFFKRKQNPMYENLFFLKEARYQQDTRYFFFSFTAPMKMLELKKSRSMNQIFQNSTTHFLVYGLLQV